MHYPIHILKTAAMLTTGHLAQMVGALMNDVTMKLMQGFDSYCFFFVLFCFVLILFVCLFLCLFVCLLLGFLFLFLGFFLAFSLSLSFSLSIEIAFST